MPTHHPLEVHDNKWHLFNTPKIAKKAIAMARKTDTVEPMNFDIRNLKTGDPFITLEQFMLLPDCSTYQTDRLFNARWSGKEWLYRYSLAKTSWDKYGQNPPHGATVRVLVNGHGTSMPTLDRDGALRGCARQVLDTESYQDWFYLSRGAGARSLVDKNLWWRDIFVVDAQ